MLADILRLSDPELEGLRNALDRGSLRSDSSLAEIQKAGLFAPGEMVRSWLSEAADQFGSIAGLAAAIRLIQADRSRAGRVSPRVELILTGPGTDVSPGRDTRAAVREIFESARRSVLIVGYAFYGSDEIFKPLARRMGEDANLTVSIVVNIHPEDGRTPESTVQRYAREFIRSNWPFHPRPDVYHLPRSLELQRSRRSSVHAKLIIADEESVYLGSANFTTAAFERNIEAGLRLASPTLGRQLTSYFEALKGDGVLVRLGTV